MSKRWLVIALVVLAGSGGVACLVWPDAPDARAEPGAETSPTNEPLAFVHRHEDSVRVDAGVGEVTGIVLDTQGAPAAGALVRLLAHAPELASLECGECHSNVFECADPSTAARLVEGIRAGTFKPPPVLAEVRSDAEGRFTFAAAPLDGLVVATLGELQGEVALEGDPSAQITLQRAEAASISVTDPAGDPLRGAVVTLYSPRDGTLQPYTTDAAGKVAVSFFDFRTWAVGELPGRLAAGVRPSAESQLTLSEPRTLVVRTRVGGQLVDGEVTISGHGEPRKHRVRGGVLELDGLAVGMLTLSAQAGEFASAEQSVELYEPRTEVDFELRRGATLYVTAVSELGEPLELVTGIISGFDSSAMVDAQNGAVLALGPVPEGEYTLHVTSDRRITVERQLDLKPGDNTLEVTLRTAPRIRGVVLDPEGNPVAAARVSVSDGMQETAVTLSDEAGAFDLELTFAGEVTVMANQAKAGDATVTTRAPIDDLKIQLAPRAVLEVELTDFDGAQVTGELSVRQPERAVIRWVELPESGPARVAGLPGGKYVLEKYMPERIPIVKELDLAEGRVTRLSLRLERGVTLTGSVVDHEGKPVPEAIVTLEGRRESVLTDAAGRFAWSGLVAGPAQLQAAQQNGQSAQLAVTVPAQDVVLRFEKPVRARGRVVDERGAVVPTFDLNGLTVNAPDGRFDVEAPTGMIDVFAAGFSPLFLDAVKGDLGDVVLKRVLEIEGVVVDANGKPVGGATVTAEGSGVPVVSDAAGRFKVGCTLEESTVGLVAARGALSGQATASPGARDVRIAMQPGTKVVGRVVAPPGKSAATLVKARHVLEAARAVELETDESGRFEFDLAQGVWSFAVRGVAGDRVIEVRGARLEVVLGDDGSGCGFVASSTGDISQLVLRPASMPSADVPWDVLSTTGGSIVVPVWGLHRQVAAAGLPCGRYTLFAVVEGSIVQQALDLGGAAQAVVLEAPPPDDSPAAGEAGLQLIAPAIHLPHR